MPWHPEPPALGFEPHVGHTGMSAYGSSSRASHRILSRGVRRLKRRDPNSVISHTWKDSTSPRRGREASRSAVGVHVRGRARRVGTIYLGADHAPVACSFVEKSRGYILLKRGTGLRVTSSFRPQPRGSAGNANGEQGGRHANADMDARAYLQVAYASFTRTLRILLAHPPVQPPTCFTNHQ